MPESLEAISKKRRVELWATLLALDDVADIESSLKSGKTKVKFNPSKAAEAIISKLPIAYCIRGSPYYNKGLYFWDGERYEWGAEIILRVVLDVVAGNMATKRNCRLTFDLIIHKLMIEPRVDLPQNGEIISIWRR